MSAIPDLYSDAASVILSSVLRVHGPDAAKTFVEASLSELLAAHTLAASAGGAAALCFAPDSAAGHDEKGQKLCVHLGDGRLRLLAADGTVHEIVAPVAVADALMDLYYLGHLIASSRQRVVRTLEFCGLAPIPAGGGGTSVAGLDPSRN